MPHDYIYNLIDRYLLGELKGKELDEFLAKIKSDPELVKELDSQKELIDLMEYHGKTSELKSKLDGIHKEMDVSKIKQQLGLNIKLTRRQKRKKVLATLTIAATISILATFGSLYFSGWFGYDKDEILDNFIELREEVEENSSTIESMQKVKKNGESIKKVIRYIGTGFALSSNGYIVTSYHVVKNVDSIFVVNISDSVSKYKAKLIYKEFSTDLAILKVEDDNFETFGVLPYTFNNEISDLGEYVYTLGYSKRDIVYNEGSISALTGYKGDTTSYQISIPVNPGNSGGPLIDEKGCLLGILSGKHSRKAGVTYAIKSSYLLNIIDSIKVDSPMNPPELPTNNILKWSKRTDQIKKLKPFIFKVEVYK